MSSDDTTAAPPQLLSFPSDEVEKNHYKHRRGKRAVDQPDPPAHQSNKDEFGETKFAHDQPLDIEASQQQDLSSYGATNDGYLDNFTIDKYLGRLLISIFGKNHEVLDSLAIEGMTSWEDFRPDRISRLSISSGCKYQLLELYRRILKSIRSNDPGGKDIYGFLNNQDMLSLSTGANGNSTDTAASTTTASAEESPSPPSMPIADLWKCLDTQLCNMRTLLQCPICLSFPTDPVRTHCGHVFCRICIKGHLKSFKSPIKWCPVCKAEITHRSLEDDPTMSAMGDACKGLQRAFGFSTPEITKEEKEEDEVDESDSLQTLFDRLLVSTTYQVDALPVCVSKNKPGRQVCSRHHIEENKQVVDASFKGWSDEFEAKYRDWLGESEATGFRLPIKKGNHNNDSEKKPPPVNDRTGKKDVSEKISRSSKQAPKHSAMPSDVIDLTREEPSDVIDKVRAHLHDCELMPLLQLQQQQAQTQAQDHHDEELERKRSVDDVKWDELKLSSPVDPKVLAEAQAHLHQCELMPLLQLQQQQAQTQAQDHHDEELERKRSVDDVKWDETLKRIENGQISVTEKKDWIAEQCNKYWNGTLPRYREDRLIEIGFDFSNQMTQQRKAGASQSNVAAMPRDQPSMRSSDVKERHTKARPATFDKNGPQSVNDKRRAESIAKEEATGVRSAIRNDIPDDKSEDQSGNNDSFVHDDNDSFSDDDHTHGAERAKQYSCSMSVHDDDNHIFLDDSHQHGEFSSFNGEGADLDPETMQQNTSTKALKTAVLANHDTTEDIYDKRVDPEDLEPLEDVNAAKRGAKRNSMLDNEDVIHRSSKRAKRAVDGQQDSVSPSTKPKDLIDNFDGKYWEKPASRRSRRCSMARPGTYDENGLSVALFCESKESDSFISPCGIETSVEFLALQYQAFEEIEGRNKRIQRSDVQVEPTAETNGVEAIQSESTTTLAPLGAEASSDISDEMEPDVPAGWKKKYDRLVKYKEEHGTAHVPRQYQHDTELANWAGTQRNDHNKDKLSLGKYNLLKEIGFPFKPRKMLYDAAWEERFMELKNHKEKTGTLTVSKKANKPLFDWVTTQRQNYNNKDDWKTNNQWKINMLNGIGFDWQPYRNRGRG